MRTQVLLASLLTLVGCRSQTPEPRYATSGKAPGTGSDADHTALQRALAAAKRLPSDGAAIKELRSIKRRLPGARLRRYQRLALQAEIDFELDRRGRRPTPLEPELIELAEPTGPSILTPARLDAVISDLAKQMDWSQEDVRALFRDVLVQRPVQPLR